MVIKELSDFPPRADLLTEIYHPLPKLTVYVDWEALDSHVTAEQAVKTFATALETTNTNSLTETFLTYQSFWRDTVALTSHLRTFKNRQVIVAVLTELNNRRRINEITPIPGTAQVVVVSETLVSSLLHTKLLLLAILIFHLLQKWLEVFIAFKTTQPRTSCSGRLVLLPEDSPCGLVHWKIWTLSTWLSGFDRYPEDEKLLRTVSQPLNDETHLCPDVLIIGGGNA
jgi:hypothetical protein